MCFVFDSLRLAIFSVLEGFSKNSQKGPPILPGVIFIDRPKNGLFGDLYTNAALVFAKNFKIPPRILAESIADVLKKQDIVREVSIAGNGFVNFFLCNEAWHGTINQVIEQKLNFSYVNAMHNEKINVEFVSANPTGPLHTGHARNAVFGSVLSNLLEKIGYNVTREFYINDKGNQIKSLARSLYLRYREVLGGKGSDNDFTKDMYCGEYIKDIASDLVTEYRDSFLNKPESEWLDLFSNYAVNALLTGIKNDLELLGIKMDVYTSEAEICDRNLVNKSLEILAKQDDVYEGILSAPKGMVLDDWEERPQTLFRSTKYGDDLDRPIRKSDGTWTYFAGDIAYHLDKIQRGFNRMIDVLGADHNGYLTRIKAAVNALSNGTASVDACLYQLVNFLENGQPVRMSKRSGVFITLRDVVERVGKDVTRFMMISRHHDVMIDFDFVKAIEFSMENPIFYIQYAYARICSVFRKAREIFGDISEKEMMDSNKSVLSDGLEIDLLKTLAFWPEYVKGAAISLEPHRIPSYLSKIAYCIHALWNKGKINTMLRFIDENNRALTISRLAMLRAGMIVIEDGLSIIGVTPLEEMK